MVLAQKIGKERPFGIVLLLFVVTFGIYGIYWHYKAHNEVYRQFELGSEGKDEGIVWLILGYVLFQPLLWVFQWTFVSNVRTVRERLGFKQNLSPGNFLALVIIPAVLAFLAAIAFYIPLIIAGVAEASDGNEPTDEEVASALLLGAAIAAPLAIAAMVMLIIAYAKLQGQLNELWRAYDSRMAHISGGRPAQAPGWSTAPSPPSGGQAPQAPRQW
ncbi:MAG: DUF4234 domain-containing protein [Thermoplasmatota archaeon]